jgi:hypothetical protein
MPGLVPGIHGVPVERQSLLNLGVFPYPARLVGNASAVMTSSLTTCPYDYNPQVAR